MSAIYKEIEISWGGKVYSVTPTYAMIQKIEQKLSIGSVIMRIAEGNAPVSQMSDIVAALLNGAGCKVKGEDIYVHIMSELGDDGGAAEFGVWAGLILTAFMPQQKPKRGNPEAPAPKAAGAPPISTGQSTTPLQSVKSESPLANSGG